MKQALFILAFVFATTYILPAQMLDTSALNTQQEKHKMYLKKAKNNRLAGWVMLGAGLGMTILGASQSLSNFSGGGLLSGSGSSSSASSSNSEGSFLATCGLVSMLGSIPCFIGGGINKRKARLMLKQDKLSIGNKVLYKASYPAVAITVSF
ncbi:MAG: hypothetical protein V4722_24085 [Bacteroidota bacterium]